MDTPRRSIVILTGAGVSAESGVPTFRDPDGVWARHDPEEIATPGGFRRNPDLVHAFYNDRRRQLLSPDIRPNAAHHALARLERARPGCVTLVTQNIDDLHERAGSAEPLHMHGELLKARCIRSGRVQDCRQDITTATPCSCCRSAGLLRPHVVWFGEIPFGLDRIHRQVRACGLFVAIGTSGQVHPASTLVALARDHGARTIELNLERTGSTWIFDESRHGPAATLVPEWVDSMLECV